MLDKSIIDLVEKHQDKAFDNKVEAASDLIHAIHKFKYEHERLLLNKLIKEMEQIRDED